MSSLLTRDPSTSTAARRQDGIAGDPIPFGRLLRVEWGKATDTRAARWLLGFSAVAAVLIMLAPMLAKHSVDQTWRNYLDFPGLVLTTLLPVVAILTMTTEWTQRTVLTTFTQEPRRSRVITAKVFVAGLIGVAGAAFGGLLTFLAVWLVSGWRHVEHDMGSAQVVGFLLFVLLNMMMGVAFGALLHNTAASIVLFFILPTAFGILGSAVKSLGRWIDPSRTFDWVMHGQWHGHTGGILVSVLLWVALPLTAV
ncbi:MAG: ABC transporter permease, partial [Actinobacteria bacterium]|nr:ABC transporter permease [Actinomycetota bacterium]